MALFSRSKKQDPDSKAKLATGQATDSKTKLATGQDTKETAPVGSGSAASTKALPTDRNLEAVIIKPRITEKAVGKSEQNVYTFIVRRDATKYDVRDAVKKLFGVTPVKVNTVNRSPRQFMSRMKGRTVSEPGLKKAYVYLKTGDHIDLA